MKLKIRFLSKYLEDFEKMVRLYLEEQHKVGFIKFKNGYYYFYEVVDEEKG